jgi:hypothetical protein
VHRRVRLDNLRGMDPITLEVTITDVVRRPMGQIDPVTLVDLIAMGEADLPAGLRTMLIRFRDRIARDISDIPEGTSFKEFLDEIEALPAQRVPAWFRERLMFEATREDRHPKSGALAKELIDKLNVHAPEPFVIGHRGVKVAKAVHAAAPSETAKRVAPAKSREARQPKKVRTNIDVEREQMIQSVIVEKLAARKEAGLDEKVLLLSVRKQAGEDNVTGSDIVGVLKVLESRGLVRRTSGRWVLDRRW